jgi:hypothetical protein
MGSTDPAESRLPHGRGECNGPFTRIGSLGEASANKATTSGDGGCNPYIYINIHTLWL